MSLPSWGPPRRVGGRSALPQCPLYISPQENLQVATLGLGGLFCSGNTAESLLPGGGQKGLRAEGASGSRLAVTVISEFSELQIIQALPVSPGDLKVK